MAFVRLVVDGQSDGCRPLRFFECLLLNLPRVLGSMLGAIDYGLACSSHEVVFSADTLFSKEAKFCQAT